MRYTKYKFPTRPIRKLKTAIGICNTKHCIRKATQQIVSVNGNSLEFMRLVACDKCLDKYYNSSQTKTIKLKEITELEKLQQKLRIVQQSNSVDTLIANCLRRELKELKQEMYKRDQGCDYCGSLAALYRVSTNANPTFAKYEPKFCPECSRNLSV